ncbi:TerC family protein [Hypericibacter sp.]|uniref:TerC family protein n=1 Tax=Hypericibacter sp. TaxID=2705401 RepID=UPI003D6D7B97
MMELLADPQAWLSLVTLTVLEIVLGIDNLVFIAVLVGKLPREQQPLARRLGIGVALGTRLLLLASIAWIAGLTQPAFTLFDHAISWRDLVLILGGLFLIYKSTHEIHGSLEGEAGGTSAKVQAAFMAVVIQIGILDIVFSLDSVITAVGMAEHFEIMVTAVVLAMIVMLVAAGPVSGFVERHPTVKMLALSFLLLIGTALVADGMGFHIPKGYIYAAMGFSVMVEGLNLLAKRRRQKPVELRQPYSNEPPAG